MTTTKENTTLEILNDSNFKSWKQDLFLLLEGKDISEYILKNIIIKIFEKKYSKRRKK